MTHREGGTPGMSRSAWMYGDDALFRVEKLGF